MNRSTQVLRFERNPDTHSAGEHALPAAPPSVQGQDLSPGALARAIEGELIPRLMLAHRVEGGCLDLPEGRAGMSSIDVERLVALALAPEEELAVCYVMAMRMRGVPADDLCLGLLAPAARRLGQMWEEDLCSFADVTYGLGRLQRILRELGPAFEQPRGALANGRRLLLLPAPGEQHTFGLLMVAKFFRHEGWDVELGLDPGGTNAAARVRANWFDLVGFSLGAAPAVPALRDAIHAIRKASTNPRVGIMVGGSIFSREPECAQAIGADMVTADGRNAPALAARLVGERAGLRRQ